MSTNQLQTAADYLSQHDAALAPIIAVSPLPSFQAHANYYEELTSSIISQQLSVKAAHTIQNRFVELFGGTFPTPEQILEKDIEELRSVGLSRPKAGYLHDLARHILDGKVQFERFDRLSNDEIIRELVAVKGVGEWTAHMFLIFCMAQLDVLPIGDLGIRNGVQKLYQLDHVPAPDEVTAIALKQNWHPYESVASWYIWQSLDNTPKL